jgi:hypothetical protein
MISLNVVGVDMGSGMDLTALSVVSITPTETRFTVQSGYYEYSEFSRYGPPYQYNVRHLERLQIGTSTPETAVRVKKIIQVLSGNTPVIIDITATGRTGIEPFIKSGLSCMAVTITGGDTTTRSGNYLRIPKRDLIGNLKISFETGQMKIARTLPDSDTLIRELMAFKMKPNISTRAGDMEEWREGTHDDLVFAVALSCFAGRYLCETAGPVLISSSEEKYQISPV